MDFLEFIFQLLSKYVPMPESKLRRLMLDGKQWYEELGTGENPHPLLVKFKFFSEQWYLQILLGILYLYADARLNEYVNAPKRDDDDDEDDEDDEDEDDDRRS